MNTNSLKRFAKETRIKLLDQVGRKLEFVLTQDTAELRGKEAEITQLRNKITEHGKEQVIEMVAYTWFNRLMALRFMDANGYTIPKVVTPLPGMTNPEILQNALGGNIEPALQIDRQRLNDLLDGKTAATDAYTEAYRMLLVASCNQWHTAMPFMFERISDYTELLLPDDLLSDYSIVADIRNGMSDEDCQHEEILGWLYQFYISEKKDEVFASKSAVKKEDIPAATQLFTPRWIVEYMVQNTLGKLWLQNRPNSVIKEFMPYYVDTSRDKCLEYLKVESVEEIQFLDQACGSGHILVYAFELFTKIYEEEGYNISIIPQLIIEKNIIGFEIDERAAQLSGFALMMKARRYNSRFFKKLIKPKIICYYDLELEEFEIKEIFKSLNIDLPKTLLLDLLNMNQASNFGSLIRPHTSSIELRKKINEFNETISSTDLFVQHRRNQVIHAMEQLFNLGNTYHCIVDNPPYMGGGKMNIDLSTFVKNNYPEGKADLSACFMISALNMSKDHALIGMVTLDSWMFLTSFELLREKLLKLASVSSMVHIGWNCFPQGHVYNRGSAFVIAKKTFSEGTFINLSNVPATVDKLSLFRERIGGNKDVYVLNIQDFKSIAGYPFGYWLKKETIKKLQSAEQLSKYGKAMKGLDTCDNERFVRFWYEVSFNSFSSNESTKHKWHIYQKGGDFRKWYGNIEKVVNWQNNGSEIKAFKNPDGSQKSRPQNVINYFKEGITWSAVGSGDTSYRLLQNSIFGGGGNGFFPKKELLNFFLGFLNSKVATYFLDLFNPTINNLAGDLGKLPIEIDNTNTINQIVEEIIHTSKEYWYSTEIYWGMTANSLMFRDTNDISLAYSLYKQFWSQRFFDLHRNEEELNQQFINIYALQGELTSKVSLNDITILKNEVSIINGKLNFHEDEVFKQFLGYAVGCFFGRYSLDEKGLILANQGDSLKDFYDRIVKTKVELSFLPDEDNIIPVLEGEWFKDDIVGMFKVFLKAAFGEEHFEKNLGYIEGAIGKDIRKYFAKDFYNDHIKRYKKRPIYWMFSSPKGHFKALIYMHRYQPDLCSKLLNDYLQTFIVKLEAKKQDEIRLSLREDISAREKTAAIKEIDKLELMLKDCRDYEKTLFAIATQKIAIDLDDGVKVNYQKFKNVLVPIKGLEKEED